MAWNFGRFFHVASVTTYELFQEWRNDNVPIGTQSNLAAKMYDAAVSQYVGWYDDPSLGGLEQTLQRLNEADPTFSM